MCSVVAVRAGVAMCAVVVVDLAFGQHSNDFYIFVCLMWSLWCCDDIAVVVAVGIHPCLHLSRLHHLGALGSHHVVFHVEGLRVVVLLRSHRYHRAGLTYTATPLRR